jgi:GTP cyclohydrolase I
MKGNMSEVVQNAAPAAPVAPVTEQPKVENAELSAEEQEIEAKLEDSSEEGKEKTPKREEKKAKEVEKRLKKLKLKVDGKEIEEEIDLDDEERLTREFQLSKLGQKRAQEKAELEKQVGAFMKALGEDPFAAMKELGMNPDQVIEDYINKQLEQAKKSPEQVEKERLESELKAIRAEREREKEEHNTKELARLQEQAFQQYDTQMEQALNKSGLPKTPYTVKKMADYMLVALEAGHDVTPDDVVDVVREEMNSDLKEMFASLDEETIEGLLGEQVINKLRKRRVAKAQAAQKALGTKVVETGNSAKTSETPKEKKSFKDFFGM